MFEVQWTNGVVPHIVCNPHTRAGYGADQFSWAAALLLDMLYREGSPEEGPVW